MKVIGMAGPRFAYRLSSTYVTLRTQFTCPYMRIGWALVALKIRLKANSFMHTPRIEILLFQSGLQLKCSSESLCVSQKQSEKHTTTMSSFCFLPEMLQRQPQVGNPFPEGKKKIILEAVKKSFLVPFHCILLSSCSSSFYFQTTLIE